VSEREAGDDEIDLSDLLPPIDGAAGPARRLSSSRTSAMVSAIVEAASAVPEPAAPEPAVVLSPFEVTRTVMFEPPRAPRGLLLRSVLAVAPAIVAIGSTAAAVWLAMREPSPPGPRPAAVQQPAAAPADPDRRTPVRTADPRDELQPADAQPAPAQPEPEVEPEPELEPEEAPGPKPVLEPEQPRRERQRRVRGPRRKVAPEPVPVAPEHAPVEPAPVPPLPESAPLPSNAPVEDIVSLANQRRKEKRWRAAEELYELAMRDHAGTDAAAIATVASASLHLDHLADPAGALRRFHKALHLRPDGALAEEARWGLAETHRALGDGAAERAALRTFLSAHPRSVNAGRARQRLAELGVR
jgi:hypothetical protein